MLAGHDGRRGFINHLAVEEAHRRQGIASHLLELSEQSFLQNGIHKSALFVLRTNSEGAEFYRSIGWQEENIVKIFSHLI